jgi:hypothetical protein
MPICKNELCHNPASEKCIIKCCGHCCTNNECKMHLHKKAKKAGNKKMSQTIATTKIKDVEEEVDEYQYNNWFKYKKEMKVLLDEYMIPELANIVINYSKNDSCLTCSKCGICDYDDGVCYTCDGCHKIFCYDCRPYDRHYTKCGIRDCYYCRNGNCFNSVPEDEIYCDNCYIESDESDIDLTDNSDSEIDTIYSTPKQRRKELIEKLAEYKLKLRTDSKLCDKYIKEGDIDIDDVVERMCQMKYLYDYCDMASACIEAEEAQAEELNAGYFPDCTVFEQAEMIALEKKGGDYPSIYPWM